MQNPTPADIQRLIERFVKAGWIKYGVRVGRPPYDFRLLWTEEGRRGMTRVRSLLLKNRPELFDNSTRRRGLLSRLWLEWRVRQITPELRPPEFTGIEYRLVLAVAATSSVEENGRVSPEYYSDLEF